MANGSDRGVWTANIENCQWAQVEDVENLEDRTGDNIVVVDRVLVLDGGGVVVWTRQGLNGSWFQRIKGSAYGKDCCLTMRCRLVGMLITYIRPAIIETMLVFSLSPRQKCSQCRWRRLWNLRQGTCVVKQRASTGPSPTLMAWLMNLELHQNFEGGVAAKLPRDLTNVGYVEAR